MLASPGGVDAVTVGGRDVDCPVCGHTFAVKTYASYGSYVYEWESKYDLIYFPASERFWFWLCPKWRLRADRRLVRGHLGSGCQTATGDF
jgi:hypothetical protein